MKKNIVIAVIFAMVMGMSTANAAEIPTESLPFYVNDESVIIAESHISDILDEVKNGLGCRCGKQGKQQNFKCRAE